MPLIICSPSTKHHALRFSDDPIVIKGKLKDISYGVFDELVIGIGGGSVIDFAKIVSGKRSCVAIPTTASGACMTSHSVVWGEEKKNIETQMPVMMPLYEMWAIKLPERVLDDTFTDCLCHCFEALIGEEADKRSAYFAKLGLEYLRLFLDTGFINYLITAGNFGGKAIERSPTSIIHKPSYKYTLSGLSHGEALRKVIQEKGFSSCQDRRSLYTDIVQLPLISCILDT